MTSPYPKLKMWPTSNLSFEWAEYVPGVVGTFDASLGADGVSLGMVMLIHWEDLELAVYELLGVSYRDGSRLRRSIPWQHPYFNQLFVKRISKVQGIRLEGNNLSVPELDFILAINGLGAGYTPNTGPWTNYNLALLTIQFWRPPYFIRTDSDIVVNGQPQEWLRWVDKNWELSTQMLSRENAQFVWSRVPDNPPTAVGGFQGSVGQKVCKLKVKRRWYQVPERALFDSLVDMTPNGIPRNILYTQTLTVNPITGYEYPVGSIMPGCVNSPRGGGDDDNDPAKRFFGCPTGTLLFEGVEFVPQPLQLPPYLMQIPSFGANEAISQVQYDVVFHFEFFDPPRSQGLIAAHPSDRGHNLMPWSGDGMWYPVQSQLDVTGSGWPTTPLQYADFTDLFKIL